MATICDIVALCACAPWYFYEISFCCWGVKIILLSYIFRHLFKMCWKCIRDACDARQIWMIVNQFASIPMYSQRDSFCIPVKFCFAMFCPICLWFWQCGPVMPMHGAVRTSWIFTLCLNPLRSFAGGFSTTSLLISLFLFLCNSRHLGSRFANMHSCGPCSARNKPGYGGFIVWNLQDLLTKSCSFKKECFLYWKRWHPGLLRGWPMRQPITLWQGSGPLED